MENTTVARSSDDFWPQDPASHTTHVAVNAYNSLFMVPLLQPDWDMFHSRHPAALLHATARVVTHRCRTLRFPVSCFACHHGGEERRGARYLPALYLAGTQLLCCSRLLPWSPLLLSAASPLLFA